MVFDVLHENACVVTIRSHMIIGPSRLLKFVNGIKLVEDLSERELTNPEGAGFDLRVGEVHVHDGGNAFLGIDERETPKIKTIATYDPKKKKQFIINPGDFYLLTTVEKVNLPKYITANFKPRTTTFRSGLIIRTGNVSPGYEGKLTFAVHNVGNIPVTIELGARVIHIQFYYVEEGGNMYRGQWQGGRVTTQEREKQV